MKNYERPIVLATEDMSEGVYAASGTNVTSVDCWIIDKNGETTNVVDGELAREFQFDAHHFSIEVGHAPDSVWVVTFDQVITAVKSCSGMTTSVNGNVVSIYRSWDNMNQNENWGFALRVACAEPETLKIDSSYIVCNL